MQLCEAAISGVQSARADRTEAAHVAMVSYCYEILSAAQGSLEVLHQGRERIACRLHFHSEGHERISLESTCSPDQSKSDTAAYSSELMVFQIHGVRPLGFRYHGF